MLWQWLDLGKGKKKKKKSSSSSSSSSSKQQKKGCNHRRCTQHKLLDSLAAGSNKPPEPAAETEDGMECNGQGMTRHNSS